MRRLIRNLLDNARRHGAPPVRIALRRERNDFVLDVIDAGPGVPEAERERVFSPFHRLSEDNAGAGLGLSLVRQIARLHGGDAIVASQPELLPGDDPGERGVSRLTYAAFFSRSCFHCPCAASPFIAARCANARCAAATFSVLPVQAFCGAACSARP